MNGMMLKGLDWFQYAAEKHPIASSGIVSLIYSDAHGVIKTVCQHANRIIYAIMTRDENGGVRRFCLFGHDSEKHAASSGFAKTSRI